MTIDPLTTTVLDLNDVLGPDAELMIGGGLGLYVKQQYLEASEEKTNLQRARWPRARATQDIDLFLGVEVVADAGKMARYRHGLDQLGFEVVEEAKWMKFRRDVGGQEVLVDIMVGPLGEHADRITLRGERAKAKGSSSVLHARLTSEALAVEDRPLRFTVQGGDRSCEVQVPQAFSFALMKLGAIRDRIHDANKDEGRHHALDLYRIAAMLTEPEARDAEAIAQRFAGDQIVTIAMETLDELFGDTKSLGWIRFREHPLCPEDADLGWLDGELRHLLAP